MKIKLSLFFLILLCTKLKSEIPTEEMLQRSKYFNTEFSKNYDQVSASLINDDKFKSIDLVTQDGLLLEALYKKVNNPKCTIIAASGFLPGRMEGLACLVPMIPANYNILFFNARGHGNSEGFWSFVNFGNYGINEYLDIITAIKYANQQNPGCPIILYGICAGAFHSLRTLLKLQNDDIKRYNIKGLVFDSGWTNIQNVAVTAIDSQIDDMIKNRIARFALKKTISLYRSMAVLPSMQINAQELRIEGKLKDLKLPIFFIHSENDQHSPISDVKKIADEVESKLCWWIKQPKAKHACHILKYKGEYCRLFNKFCDHVIKN